MHHRLQINNYNYDNNKVPTAYVAASAFADDDDDDNGGGCGDGDDETNSII